MQAKKFQTLDFAESNAHRKTNARGSFETYDLFFLAWADNCTPQDHLRCVLCYRTRTPKKYVSPAASIQVAGS